MPGIRTFALLSLAAATSMSAQVPQVPPAGAPASQAGPAAKLLLANTGELELTDAQVVRLAAIARRAEARRRSMRATLDSARTRFGPSGPADSVARRQFRDRVRSDFDRTREQARVDQRDAIAVLTPDQQARAWELVANRGRGVGPMRRGGMGRGGMQRGMRGMGRGMRGMDRVRPGFRGPDGRPEMRPNRPAPRPPQE